MHSLCKHLSQIPTMRPSIFVLVACKSFSVSEVERVTSLINDSPFPGKPLHLALSKYIQPAALSADFVENVLGSLFAAHSNGLKALEFFRFSLRHSVPSSFSFEMTLHILVRMRYFEKAWEFMGDIGKTHPSLLTLKSMSIILSKIAKFQSYEDTLEAFERLEKKVFVGHKFGTEEFNVLLQAFCTEREVKEARSVFQKMHHRFTPNIKTMNILLLGFKEARDITAMELFYHEIVRRGFKANSSTYNIRIDAYCKKGYFGDALRIFEEMEHANFPPSLKTITTLIHGSGIARNINKARQLFNEIGERNLQPDTGAYNALISSLVKCRDIISAMEFMNEMEERHIMHDNVTYHTVFFGLMKQNDVEKVCDFYKRMISRNFVPKTRTVVMLMKFFCVNSRLDLGMEFWKYMLEKGYCPHGHALDLLVTGLCSRGRLQEAFECSKQFVERGMRMSDSLHRMLERYLQQSDSPDKLKELNQMIKNLHSVLPPSKGHALAYSFTTAIN
ncbi:pentatricopeptide repeat-containing protein At3g61360 isoform X2 [Mercurialis annua]|uniref:pentatricopeptide repeat-containing protein At3g61360 isoform X2 n=1 Tax=Mercurialis annua TaxID=3986 RepID=UPI0021600E9C|nr:pentatricopeptide repeat-containing protein At3g61360 isoform X2 [Mercurialis annua]XP_050232142.1 pentatricopeptide repeat-containing protein At3g61360 isoform X2 [Mercurialis annua]